MIDIELTVLKQVDHPHIIGMHEHFDTPDKLYLILDYVEGGELFDRIVDEVTPPPPHARARADPPPAQEV